MIIGAGLGLAGGYVWDHYLGDSDYTAREALIDTAGGALGGSVVRPLAKGSSKLGRALWQTSKKGGGAGLSTIPAQDLVYTSAYAYSVPVIAQTPRYARGAAAVVGTGYAYDYFQSQASSASSYQQHGGAGGTPPSRRFKNIDAIPAGSRVTKPVWKTTAKHEGQSRVITIVRQGGSLLGWGIQTCVGSLRVLSTQQNV